MEWLSEIWVWIIGAIGGLSLSAIITAIIIGCLKGSFSKVVSKINVEKISEKATEKGIEKVKKIAFTHNIQPLVLSEMEKVNEKSVEALKRELQEIKEQYNTIINLFDKFACYFDDSLVAEQKKVDFKEAINEAKNEPIEVESVVVEDLVEESKTEPTSPKTVAKTTQNIER